MATQPTYAGGQLYFVWSATVPMTSVLISPTWRAVVQIWVIINWADQSNSVKGEVRMWRTLTKLACTLYYPDDQGRLKTTNPFGLWSYGFIRMHRLKVCWCSVGVCYSALAWEAKRNGISAVKQVLFRCSLKSKEYKCTCMLSIRITVEYFNLCIGGMDVILSIYRETWQELANTMMEQKKKHNTINNV